jgi:GTPase SAR1 family protein
MSGEKQLIVRPIKEPSGAEHPDPISPILPTHEFSMLIIAPRGSGKTTLILNFLSDFYKAYFHSISVFSPTMNGDSKWTTIKQMKGILKENKNIEDLKKPQGPGDKKKSSRGESDADDDEDSDADDEADAPNYNYFNSFHGMFASTAPPAVAVSGDLRAPVPRNLGSKLGQKRKKKDSDKKFTGKIPSKDFYPDYDEMTLQNIMTKQMAQIKQFKKRGKTKHHADRKLLIFDDLVGSNLFANTKVNPFRRLNTTLRHYSTSVIMVSQAYKEIPKTVRINTSVLILYDIANQQELEDLYAENNCGLTKDEWLNIYRYCTAEPFNFMYINYKLPKPDRIMKNFSEKIPIKPRASDRREQLQKEYAKEEEKVILDPVR